MHLEIKTIIYNMFAKDSEIFDSYNSTYISFIFFFYVCQDRDLDECLFYDFWHFLYNF